MPKKGRGGKKTKETPSSPFSQKVKQKGKLVSNANRKTYNLRGVPIEEAYDADSEGDLGNHYKKHEIVAKDDVTASVDSEMSEDVKSELMAIDDTGSNIDSSDKNQVSSSYENRYKSYLMKSLINKENLTPPETHSTPATNLVKKADDSLFGFNMLDSPLPFSPVVAPQVTNSVVPPPSPANSFVSDSMSGSVASTISPVKRKIGFGFYDIPIELPKKKQKRKPKAAPKKKTIPKKDTGLEALRKEFQEIEMHELLIE